MHNSGQHLSQDMLNLIKAIGDSRSKQEEDKIILKEIETLKGKIKESGIKPKKMKEYLIRAIYIEMLGHDAPFAHFHALNLTQDKNLSNKRVGYLACNLLLSDSSEFLIMLVATLQKDLQSKEWIEVSTALISVIKFANSTIMAACTEIIIKLLDNNHEQIRKKSVICLYRFYQIKPDFIADIGDKMKKMLCDRDPAVMNATLNYYSEVIRKNPENYKDLVSSFVEILKQIIEHRLPKEFDYHRMPAPWIQVKLLEILGHLGRDDQSASEHMYEMLAQVMKRADDTGINIGYAIVYQCLRTICIIYPNSSLLATASATISRFLESESPNLRCTGINGLTLLIQIDTNYVMNHQQVIVDCLEQNDETLKKNTFELLYKMTNMENVEVIIDKMMTYLKNATIESHSRRDVLVKITELASRFAPDKAWFIKIMNQLFVLFGDLVTDEVLSNLIKLINEWESESNEDEFKTYTIDNYTEIIYNISTLPDMLVKLVAWVFGEYGKKLFRNNEEKVIELLDIIQYLLNKTFDDEGVKCWLITAVTKLHSSINFKPLKSIEKIIKRYARDPNAEIQQRCLEYSRILTSETGLERNQFTTIQDDLDIDINFSFLDDYVSQKISEGAAVYNKKLYSKVNEMLFSTGETQLRVKAYLHNQSIQSGVLKSKHNDLISENKDFIDSRTNDNQLTASVQDKWSKDGIKEVKPQTSANFANISSNTSNSSFGSGNTQITHGVTVSSRDPYATIKSDKVKKNDVVDNSQYFQSVHENQRKEQEKKKELAEKNPLFIGLGKSTNTKPMSNTSTSALPNNQGSKPSVIKPSTDQVYLTNQPKPQQTQPQSKTSTSSSGGGLFDGMNIKKASGTPATNTSIPQKQAQTQPQHQQQQQVNLLDFISPPTITTSITQQTPQTVSTSVNFQQLDDIFMGGALFTTNNNPPPNKAPTATVPTTSNPPVQNLGGNLFANLTINQPQSSNKITKNDFTPMNIDSDAFSESWEACQFDEEEINKPWGSLNTPQKYLDYISKAGNIRAIDVQDSEAIAAAKFKNSTVLFHTTIEKGRLSILIKCFDKSYFPAVKQFVSSLFE